MPIVYFEIIEYQAECDDCGELSPVRHDLEDAIEFARGEGWFLCLDEDGEHVVHCPACIERSLNVQT